MARGADRAARTDGEPRGDVVRFSARGRRPAGVSKDVKPSTSTVQAVICPKGKRGFTREVAVAKLHEYNAAPNRESRKNLPVRVYECPECKAWHLTSRPRR
jgi:hypothetical protein